MTERQKFTLRGLWGEMQWPCTQTDAKRTRAVSMLHSSLPSATVGTLMKSNRVLKEMKSDLREIRVRAHRNEKLWWSGQMQPGRAGRTCPQLWVSFQDVQQREFCKAGDTATLIHHHSGKSKREARSSLSAEVQAFTRLQMAEFLRFHVNLSNVDETVQMVSW